MAYSIKDLKDVSAGLAAKLQEVGVGTTEQLLEKAGSSAGRKQLADEIGASASQLLTWVNEADLMRVPGIAEGFSQLLEAAGVDTVKELATRNAENLTAKIADVNEQLNLAGRVPNQDQVAAWIAAAKDLVPKVSH
jgi:predicted flap endonuclease-1-like 5' DNA nuclease